MRSNYLKIAWRNLWKHKLFSFINVFGLVTGRFILMNFAYRVTLGIGTLCLCFGAMLSLGGITIGWRAYRTALMNPAKSLRSE